MIIFLVFHNNRCPSFVTFDNQNFLLWALYPWKFVNFLLVTHMDIIWQSYEFCSKTTQIDWLGIKWRWSCHKKNTLLIKHIILIKNTKCNLISYIFSVIYSTLYPVTKNLKNVMWISLGHGLRTVNDVFFTDLAHACKTNIIFNIGPLVRTRVKPSLPHAIDTHWGKL